MWESPVYAPPVAKRPLLQFKKLLFTSVLLIIITACAIGAQTYLASGRQSTAAAQAAPAATVSKISPTASSSTLSGSIATPKPTSTAVAAIPSCIPASTPVPNVDANGYTPGVHVITPTPVYYPVYGRNLDQVRQQLHNCGPQISGVRHDAVTTYTASWGYKYQPLDTDPGTCKIIEPVVVMQIVQVLPAWQNSTAAAWQKYGANLTAHENGHAELDAAGASTLYKTLSNLSPLPCANVDATINATANGVLGSLNVANNLYDDQTGHGATQGATL